MNYRIRLTLLLIGMFNFGTALMVVDEIIGASASGSSTYAWPSLSLGSNYYVLMGIHQSWEICFAWIILSAALMMFAVSVKHIEVEYVLSQDTKQDVNRNFTQSSQGSPAFSSTHKRRFIHRHPRN